MSKRLKNISLGGSHYLDVDGHWYDAEFCAEVNSIDYR